MLCLYLMGLDLSNRQNADEPEASKTKINEMNTTGGFGALLLSWLRPLAAFRRSVCHLLYVGFSLLTDVRLCSDSLLRSLVEALVCVNPETE